MKKAIIGGVVLILIIVSVKVGLAYFADQKEVKTNTINTSDKMEQLKTSINRQDQTLNTAITINDVIPFDWDYCYYFKEGTDADTIKRNTGLKEINTAIKNQYKVILFFKNKQIVCIINDSMDSLGFEFTLKNPDKASEVFQKSENKQCIMSRTDNKSTMEIQNLETVKKAYGYHEADPSVVNTNTDTIKQYDVVVNNNAPYEFELNKDNVPVSNNGKYDIENNKWIYDKNAPNENDKNNDFISFTKKQMGQSGKWYTFNDKSLCETDKTGKVIRTFIPRIKQTDFSIRDVKWVKDDVFAITLYSDYNLKLIIYNLKNKVISQEYNGSYTMWKIVNNVIYVTEREGNLSSLNIDTGEKVSGIPIQGIKFTEKEIDPDIDMRELFKVDVNNGKIYLACNAGVYQWNSQISKWEMILRMSDYKNVFSLDSDESFISCFHVTTNDEFYIDNGSVFMHFTAKQ